MAEKHKRLLTDLAVGLALAISSVSLNWESGFPLSHLLCDGFFIAGVLLVGSGALIFCGNHGAFDMMGYGVKSVVGLFTHPDKSEEEDYFSYCQRKAEERKPFGHLLISGGIYLALAGICMVVYLMTGQPVLQ